MPLKLQKLPKEHRDATKRALARLKSLDREAALSSLQRSGIIGKHHKLTKTYGGTDSPVTSSGRAKTPVRIKK